MKEQNWNGDICFLDIPPLELARQMTLLEFNIFKKIVKSEYYRKEWTKNTGKSPNVTALIERFNKTSYWVASEIILTASPKQRVTVLIKFIELAKYLEELGNYNGVMEITSALNFSFIRRLKLAWKAVPSKLRKYAKQLDELMDQVGNYKNYRATLVKHTGPCVPFQGVYLTDLTFIEEKPDKLPNGHINFEKMNFIYKVFSDVKKFQAIPYNFVEVPTIQEFLKNPGVILPDDQLWYHSKKCEPSIETPSPSKAEKSELLSRKRSKTETHK